jgi:hypothetical protein
MLGTILTVLVPLCTGLCVLAWKEPAIYARMHWPLQISALVVFVAAGIYALSVQFAF